MNMYEQQRLQLYMDTISIDNKPPANIYRFNGKTGREMMDLAEERRSNHQIIERLCSLM